MRLAQDPQVMGDCGLAQLELRDDLAYAERFILIRQHQHYPEARGVSERGKDASIRRYLRGINVPWRGRTAYICVLLGLSTLRYYLDRC